jgi:hypothetical protein
MIQAGTLRPLMQGAPPDTHQGARPLPSVLVAPAAWLVRHRVAVVVPFVGISVVVALAQGTPNRPYLVLWFVVVIVLVCWRSPRGWAHVAMDWLPILVIAAGYDLVRSFAPDLLPRAITEPQLRFDEIVFGGKAPTVWLQDALVDRGTPHWWDFLAWVFYLSHFVVTPAIAVWLYLRHREWFYRYAWLILAVTLGGFVTYFLVPAVPPWMASREGALEPTTRIVHSVWQNLGLHDAAKVFAGDARFANPVAALPSLHAAWPFMSLLFLWSKSRRARWLLLAYNAIMVTVLVYGAEHYVSDILLGWLYATITYVLLGGLLDRRAARLQSAAAP